MSLHENLNPEQRRVMQHTNGVILVVSGPGTGKTTTIQHYITELITNKKIKPEEILAVTFTNKAADEMKERVKKLTGIQPYISTLHAFAASVLRKFPPKGYGRDFQIADDRTQFLLTLKLIKMLGINEHPRYILERLTLARNLRDKKILQEDNLEEFYRLYMKELMVEGLMDYDGLLTWCYFVFENNPSALGFFQERFKHVVVDEFQDISPIQYLLLRHLVQKQRNLLAVGDFDQSIYKFRGADVNIMLNLQKDFRELKTLFLERNYRSTSHIIQSANRLIKNNSRRKDKPLWTENKQGEKPQILKVLDGYQEAEEIAKIIKDGVKKGGKFADYAILYRIHILSRPFEEVFSTWQIPYQIVGGVGYYQRVEIQNIIAFFKLIREPENSEALQKVMLFLAQCKGIKTKFVDRKNIDGLSLSMLGQFATEDYIRDLPRQISQCAEKKKLEEIYDLVLGFTGYLDFLSKDKSTEGEKRLENVEELRSVLYFFDKNEKTLDDFLAFVETTGAEKDVEDAVKLMTVHAAKGLEFDTVFVVGAEKGMFPYYNNNENDEDIEEERRLFYVAVTRPKNTLYITYPLKRTLKGKEINLQPSPFINEMESQPKKPKLQIKPKINKSRFSKKLTRDEISEGSMVMHSYFGRGYITEITENPDETWIKAEFVNYGCKTLILEYADLKLVNQ